MKYDLGEELLWIAVYQLSFVAGMKLVSSHHVPWWFIILLSWPLCFAFGGALAYLWRTRPRQDTS